MILRVDTEVALVDLDDFTSLSAQVVGDAPIGTWGRPEDGHIRVSIRTLIALSGDRAADAQWRAAFDGMVDYARRRGWVDGDQVRMHVVAG
jgi:hypothetical protein